METELVNNYWHVYSDGKQADIPFYSDDNKVYAMNSVAIVSFQTGVRVLCVNINDTHLHVVVYGEKGEQAMKQQLHGRYLEERRIQDMRQRGNNLSNSYFGKGLMRVDLNGRLRVASKMLKEGYGSKSEGFAKALYLNMEDLKALL